MLDYPPKLNRSTEGPHESYLIFMQGTFYSGTVEHSPPYSIYLTSVIVAWNSIFHHFAEK